MPFGRFPKKSSILAKTSVHKEWEYCDVRKCDDERSDVRRPDATYDCQKGDPLGVSYSGEMNVTKSGRTCQAWAASQPHEHRLTDVGEHNHCRNPNYDDYYKPEGVWCYTTDPYKQWEYCDVPICESTMKVLDFSADNDNERDSNGEYTSATLDAGPLPESFTICSAIMVDAWTTEFTEAGMFTLLDDD